MSEKDFLNFIKNSKETDKPLDTKVLVCIEEKMNSAKKYYHYKVTAILALASFLTLLVCPQFGWNPMGANSHLPHIFMKYGVWTCGVMCGMIFMSFGSIASLLLLNQDELHLYKNSGFKYSAVFIAFSIAVLMVIGKSTGSLDFYFSLVFVLSWSLGAMLTSYSSKLVTPIYMKLRY